MPYWDAFFPSRVEGETEYNSVRMKSERSASVFASGIFATCGVHSEVYFWKDAAKSWEKFSECREKSASEYKGLKLGVSRALVIGLYIPRRAFSRTIPAGTLCVCACVFLERAHFVNGAPLESRSDPIFSKASAVVYSYGFRS